MADADLFLELAGIAGVFVGFGALIAVRSGGASGAEVAPMRAVVTFGVVAVVGGLAPVALGRYGIVGHPLWAWSSALVLVGWVVAIVAMFRTPEYRQGWAAEIEANRTARSRTQVVVGTGIFVLYLLASWFVPLAVVLHVAPEQEAGLYFTAVVLILLGAAWTLLMLVYAQRPGTSESDPADRERRNEAGLSPRSAYPEGTDSPGNRATTASAASVPPPTR